MLVNYVICHICSLIIRILWHCPHSVEDTAGYNCQEHQYAAHQGAHHCLHPQGGGPDKRMVFI